MEIDLVPLQDAVLREMASRKYDVQYVNGETVAWLASELLLLREAARRARLALGVVQ